MICAPALMLVFTFRPDDFGRSHTDRSTLLAALSFALLFMVVLLSVLVGSIAISVPGGGSQLAIGISL